MSAEGNNRFNKRAMKSWSIEKSSGSRFVESLTERSHRNATDRALDLLFSHPSLRLKNDNIEDNLFNLTNSRRWPLQSPWMLDRDYEWEDSLFSKEEIEEKGKTSACTRFWTSWIVTNRKRRQNREGVRSIKNSSSNSPFSLLRFLLFPGDWMRSPDTAVNKPFTTVYVPFFTVYGRISIEIRL